ncbi:ComEA family DNA-binding protein [Rhodococcus sp. (in: high G+C Gram-positive bacteria)]|uniref:ComEA family DNA-binding protein n=1 Tax=Rhodococcus sp. TaxID=1831 RepID=UPI001A25BBDE|nr:ComEA family DNA-binding protein [Rhodococcus sp. (in: high G+C Gram-positive bacteria)]MBJ7479113.1 ComEA family DNA-binding protein [Rhodococcus sp. (in: high G+C Gram-positive bacteria)]
MRISEERERARDRLAAMDGNYSQRQAVDDFEDSVSFGRSPEWLQDFDEDEYEVPPDSSRFDRLPERWRGTRWRPSRSATWVLAIVAALATAIGLFTVWWDSPSLQAVPPLPSPQNVTAQNVTEQSVTAGDGESAGPVPTAVVAEQAPEALVVSVVGLVRTPGLVNLHSGSRIADALAAAGGVLDGAETVGLNLAQKLADGDQIVVGAADQSGGVSASSSTTAGGTSPAAAGESGGAGLVNLNTATEAELDGLPGVGPVTAASIISWRTSNGKFTDVEQLGEVDGIGPARLAKLRVLVSV